MTKYFLVSLLMICFYFIKIQAQDTISLFNGEDLSGWNIQNDGQFYAKNGLLKLNKGTGWLRSNERFSDFELIIEFRFLEQGANSGIFVRTEGTSKEDANGWPDNGYQIQTMDTLGGIPLAHMIPYGAPDFDHISDMRALEKAYKPHGQWQVYNIIAIEENIWIRLNGVLITAATSIKNLDGHIGIQGEHGLLEFRRIDIIQK